MTVTVFLQGMPGCCSEYPIVFNGANQNLMPALDYIFYVSKRHKDYIVWLIFLNKNYIVLFSKKAFA